MNHSFNCAFKDSFSARTSLIRCSASSSFCCSTTCGNRDSFVLPVNKTLGTPGSAAWLWNASRCSRVSSLRALPENGQRLMISWLPLYTTNLNAHGLRILVWWQFGQKGLDVTQKGMEPDGFPFTIFPRQFLWTKGASGPQPGSNAYLMRGGFQMGGTGWALPRRGCCIVLLEKRRR